MIRLHPIRKRADLSVYRLAKLTGMTWAAINKLDAGETKPTYEALTRLADALALELTVQGTPTSPAEILAELTGVSTEAPEAPGHEPELTAA